MVIKMQTIPVKRKNNRKKIRDQIEILVTKQSLTEEEHLLLHKGAVLIEDEELLSKVRNASMIPIPPIRKEDGDGVGSVTGVAPAEADYMNFYLYNTVTPVANTVYADNIRVKKE